MKEQWRKRQAQNIKNADEQLEKDQAQWLENERNGVWQPACEKPDFRSEEEIWQDFLENGFQ